MCLDLLFSVNQNVFQARNKTGGGSLSHLTRKDLGLFWGPRSKTWNWKLDAKYYTKKLETQNLLWRTTTQSRSNSSRESNSFLKNAEREETVPYMCIEDWPEWPELSDRELPVNFHCHHDHNLWELIRSFFSDGTCVWYQACYLTGTFDNLSFSVFSSHCDGCFCAWKQCRLFVPRDLECWKNSPFLIVMNDPQIARLLSKQRENDPPQGHKHVYLASKEFPFLSLLRLPHSFHKWIHSSQ